MFLMFELFWVWASLKKMQFLTHVAESIFYFLNSYIRLHPLCKINHILQGILQSIIKIAEFK